MFVSEYQLCGDNVISRSLFKKQNWDDFKR